MARNCHLGRHGEIDLVVIRTPVVAFVEVKARRTDVYGSPSLAVGPTKQRRLRKLATLWLSANPIGARVIRFDVVSVIGNRVEVIEDAF